MKRKLVEYFSDYYFKYQYWYLLQAFSIALLIISVTLNLWHRNTMEEQTADIEVTVKTLDSQSRTYTVGAQVNKSAYSLIFSQPLRICDLCLYIVLRSSQWKSSRSTLPLQWVSLWTNRDSSTRAESYRMKGHWQTTVSKQIKLNKAKLS